MGEPTRSAPFAAATASCSRAASHKSSSSPRSAACSRSAGSPWPSTGARCWPAPASARRREKAPRQGTAEEAQGNREAGGRASQPPSAAPGPKDQVKLHRPGKPHHASERRRLRAVLQRASRRGSRKPAHPFGCAQGRLWPAGERRAQRQTATRPEPRGQYRRRRPRERSPHRQRVPERSRRAGRRDAGRGHPRAACASWPRWGAGGTADAVADLEKKADPPEPASDAPWAEQMARRVANSGTDGV